MECYGAFDYELGMFVSPQKNDVTFLQTILQNLAEKQALELARHQDIEPPSEYNLSELIVAVTSLDYFKDLDRALIKNPMDELLIEFNKLMKNSDLLVTSVGTSFLKNVFDYNKNKCTFLGGASAQLVPPAFDALLYIFGLSNEKFRQVNFENLIDFYFQILKEALQKSPNNLADKITKIYKEQQVKTLLPVVKFTIAKSLVKLEDPLQYQDVLRNILYYLKYSLINQEDIYEAIKNKIGHSDYDLLDYSLVSLSEKNGHLGEYFHLDINIKSKGKEQGLQLFAKILNISEKFSQFLFSGPAQKEYFFYKTLLPLFSTYGLDSMLDFAPKCYLSRLSWILVLDDLSRQGYVGLRPNSVLNYEGLRTSIENLAKFHACTIILEEKLSEKAGKIVRLDEDYGEFLKESMLIYDNGLKKMYNGQLELWCYIAEKFPEVTDKLACSTDEFKTRFKNAFFSIFSKVKKSNAIRNVVNHGDMYVGNMLFKFGKDNLIEEGKLIDFQILRYVPPTYDLLFFLFENSTKQTRDKYLEILIEDYYRFLSENIRKFNLDPEVLFPKTSYDENIKYMKSAALSGALVYAPMMHVDPNFREELFHDREKFSAYHNSPALVDLFIENEHYRNILKGLTEDIVDIIKQEF